MGASKYNMVATCYFKINKKHQLLNITCFSFHLSNQIKFIIYKSRKHNLQSTQYTKKENIIKHKPIQQIKGKLTRKGEVLNKIHCHKSKT